MAAIPQVQSCELDISVADNAGGTSSTGGAKGRTAGAQLVRVTMKVKAAGAADVPYDEGDACTLTITEVAQGTVYTGQARVEKITPALALNPEGAIVTYQIDFAGNGLWAAPTNAGTSGLTGAISAKNALFDWSAPV